MASPLDNGSAKKIYSLTIIEFKAIFSFFFFYSEKIRGSGIFRCSDKHRLELMSDQYQTTMPTAKGKYTLTFPIVYWY